MKNENINDYWAKRELEHINKKIKDDKVIAKRIKDRQLKAMDDIQNQIDAFYGRYADKEGITIQEAKKRVTKIDMEKYQKKAKKYVEGAHSGVESIAAQSFTKIANEEMRLYNLTMKVNRLELLKMHVELEVLAATSDIENYLSDELVKSAMDEYERLSGILGETLNYSEKHIKTIVDSSFMSAQWSERLWGDSAALRNELDTLLHRGIIQGKNPKVLARDLRKKFNTSVYESERLMRTEMARVQQDVFTDSAKQVGVSQYKYIAEPDACDKCAALDGKVFDFEDAEIGINSYPMHPNCRCSQSLYVDREAWERKLEEKLKEENSLEKTMDSINKINAENEKLENGDWGKLTEEEAIKVYDRNLEKLKELEILKEKLIEKAGFRVVENKKIDEFFYNTETYKQWNSNIGEYEKELIYDYTNTYFDNFNQIYREGAQAFIDDPIRRFTPLEWRKKLPKQAEELSSIIGRYTTEKSFTTFRKHNRFEGFEDFTNSDIGKTRILDKGFLSSSLDESVTKEFGTEISYEIKVDKGLKVGSYMGEHGRYNREKEFLFKPGTKFKVIDVINNYDDGFKQQHVILEALGDG